MLLKYLTELKNSLSKGDFRAFITDVENDIKVNILMMKLNLLHF